jgi:hypothetical protein
MSINPDNYIVLSKSIIGYDKFDPEMVRGINLNIVRFMDNLDYFCVEADSFDLNVSKRFYFLLTFMLGYSETRASFGTRVKKRIGLMNQRDVNTDKFTRQLSTLLDEYPQKVTITIEPRQSQGRFAGYGIITESEPGILAKKRHLNRDKWVEPSRYKEIIESSRRFHRSIIAALGGVVEEEPNPVNPRMSDEPPMIDWRFVETTPRHVQMCLREANLCFQHECYVASSIMLRKVVEVATTLKFLQTGNDSRLLDKEKNEISLTKRLKILIEIFPPVRKDAQNMLLVKWWGDKGAHDPSVFLLPETVQTVIAPKVKTFLHSLQLKVS